MIEIVFVRMPSSGDLPVPAKASPGDSGYDLQATHGALITPGAWIQVDTGFGVELPPGYEAQVRPRSGLAARSGVTVLNAPGTIDNGYRGAMQVILINHSKQPYVVSRGDRIAQLVLAPVVESVAREASAFTTATARGDGGFGSTGI